MSKKIEETFDNCEHLCKKVSPQPQYTVSWNVIHGFKTKDATYPYIVGVDMRFFGARIQDVIIKCKTKKVYDYYISMANSTTSTLLQGLKNDNRMTIEYGNKVNKGVGFNWNNGKNNKHFNITKKKDYYSIEK